MIGETAKACVTSLAPILNLVFPVLQGNMDPRYSNVCNNACWATGEICIRIGSDGFRPYADPIIAQLLKMISQEIPRNLNTNLAITIGRLGLVVPDRLAPHLAVYLEKWCTAMRNLRDDAEKDSSFRGMVTLIKMNPQVRLVVHGFSWIVLLRGNCLHAL